MKTTQKTMRLTACFVLIWYVICLWIPSVSSANRRHVLSTVPLPKEVLATEGQFATVTAQVTNATESNLIYQWYFAPAGSKQFKKSSITTATYRTVMTQERDGRTIYCVITDKTGQSVATQTTTLKMLTSITQQPNDVTAAIGETARITVKAHGKGKLTYQWYYADAGKHDFKRSSITTNTYRVTMKNRRAGRRVYCVITDGAGRATTTEIATLKLPSITPLVITKQPKNATAQWGQPARVTVTASGTGPLTYQWYYFDTAQKAFLPSSITTATYQTTMNEKREGRRIYCQITDSAGQSISTQVAVLYLVDPIIVTEQPSNQTAAMGKTIRTSVKAIGKDLTYQWYIRKLGGTRFEKSSVTTASYSTKMSDLVHGRQLYCVITDKYCNQVITKMVTFNNASACIFGKETPLGKTSQGYKFSKTCQTCGKTEFVYYDSILTFVDDDAKMQAMLHWERIIDATGINMTAALIGKQMQNTTDYDSWSAYAGWDLLSRLQEKGVDFVHHTYNHLRLTTLTEEQLHQDFQKAKETLKQYGVESNILVYPFNAHNALVDSVAAQYFKAAFCGKNQIITDLTNPYDLTRININDASCAKAIPFTKDTIVECNGVKQLATLKEELNQALNRQGWLVCLSHAYDSPSGQYYFDRHSEQTIITFCHHVQTLNNVKIVTLSEGFIAATEIADS